MYSNQFVGRNNNLDLDQSCFTQTLLPVDKGPFVESFESCVKLMGSIQNKEPVFLKTYQLGIINLPVFSIISNFLNENFEDYSNVSVQVAESCNIVRDFQRYSVDTPSMYCYLQTSLH